MLQKSIKQEKIIKRLKNNKILLIKRLRLLPIKNIKKKKLKKVKIITKKWVVKTAEMQLQKKNQKNEVGTSAKAIYIIKIIYSASKGFTNSKKVDIKGK